MCFNNAVENNLPEKCKNNSYIFRFNSTKGMMIDCSRYIRGETSVLVRRFKSVTHIGHSESPGEEENKYWLLLKGVAKTASTGSLAFLAWEARCPAVLTLLGLLLSSKAINCLQYFVDADLYWAISYMISLF